MYIYVCTKSARAASDSYIIIYLACYVYSPHQSIMRSWYTILDYTCSCDSVHVSGPQDNNYYRQCY